MAAAAKSSIPQSLIILLLVMTVWPVGNVSEADLSHPALLSNMESGKVCTNIDVRNTVENLEKKLRNCTVVEGFLQIVLIDIATADYYENLTFPELREITGYLLLYRVQGLVSVAKLFPNLTVIRGSVLFHNYALVIFELRSLLDIGLKSLTVILRGSVRIEKNPLLCYVDTIDWDRIAKAGRGGHFIKENKNPATCPNTCPTGVECPVSGLSGGRPTKLCWNSNYCQKVCSPECEHLNKTCFSSGHHECCHPECLGSCSGTRSSECTACRHVIFEGKCVKKCPTNTFEYLGRRCVKETECREIKNQLVLQSTAPQIHWKPFNGQCLSECPPGYVEDEKDPHTCKKCIGDCPKICLGGKVNSVADAQKFKDCTYVNGSLDIHVRGGSSIVKEFESNLGKIQEIKGYLKIARSYPLVSLNFLRDLNIIHGEYFDKRNYSFLVLDNQNLQELWDWENRKTKLKIKKGKIFFHFNSKLCLSKIEELVKYADIQPYDERDVSRTTNGDRATCNMKNIQMEIHSLGPEVAVLKWQNFRKTGGQMDYRQLLGYLVYYREAPDGNVTMFDGQNACGSDVWKVVDVEPNEDDEMTEFTILPHLKPFTTYAAYIRTYTLSSAEVGGQSNITYFKTKPSTPSQPINVRADSLSHSEIIITWAPPKNPNGDVSHYIVNGARVTDSSEYVRKRNYCSEPLAVTDVKKLTSDEKSSENDLNLWANGGTSPSEKTESEQCCSCTDKKPRDSIEDETEYQIQFEDHLHNNIYFKNPNPVFRPRTNISRNATETTTPASDSSTTTAVPDVPSVGTNVTDSDEVEITSSEPHNDSNRFYHVVKEVYLVVSHLHHFTEYNIEVKACQNRSFINANERAGLPSPCSLQSLTTIRTQPLGNADDIDISSLVINSDNLTSGTVFIKWDQPEDPNGLVVSYHIEYKPADAVDYKPIPVCITQVEYEAKMGYSLHDLMPGNYSLRLRATSQAGNGNWTQPRYFIIPDTRGGMKQEVLAIVVVAVCIALSLVVGVPVYFFYKRKYGLQIPNGILYASVNPEYMSAGLVYEPDEWEVAREKISVLEELGQGSFGMVYKGEAKNIDENIPLIKCAVKTVNETASLRERIEFLQEASVMKAFNCHHVVKLLGVVSRDHPTLVIMELMANGDLKAFLRSRRPENNENTDIQPPTLRQILQMAAEIADGMAYLTAKKFVHRDLAARNCMVAEDMTVKIGDFGMTRDIYETDYYRKGGKGLLPVRWMAPECLKDGLFSSQSDVWSYGIVLWEMATLASQPYQGLSNEQVLKYVINGGCMEKPENCPEKLYALMKQCWEHDPRTRPTFTELIEILLPDIKNNKFREVSFYFTQRTELCNHNNDESDDGALQSTPLRTRWVDNPNSRENSDDESEVQYFPSPRNTSSENRFSQNPHNSSHNFIDIPPECQEAAAVVASGGTNCSRGYSIHSNDGSKGLSIPSSDSSKGSKASNYSNGSIVNGHVGAFVPGRTTRC